MSDQDLNKNPGSEQEENHASSVQTVPAGQMSAWTVDNLPVPPPDRFELRRILGPGLLMVGLAIGGGEWLTGQP